MMMRSVWGLLSTFTLCCLIAACGDDSAAGPPDWSDAGVDVAVASPDSGGGPHADAAPAGRDFEGLKSLEEAGSGDRVRLTSGTYEGPVVVGAGVTLYGEGEDSRIENQDKGGVLLITSDAEKGPTVIQKLSLAAHRGAAVVISGNGEVILEDLTIEVQAGIGVAADGLRKLTLARVRIRGKQPLSALVSKRYPLRAIDTPLLGLVASKVGNLQTTDLEVRGFAGFGALLHESYVQVTGGSFDNNVGVAMLVHGGEATVDGLTIADNPASRAVLSPPAAGLLLSGGVTFRGDDLVLRRNGGAGLVQGASVALLRRPTINANGRFGVRLQGGAEAKLDNAEISGNVGVGLLFRGGSRLALEDSRVALTKPLGPTRGLLGAVGRRFGDGLQMVMAKSDSRLSLRHVVFADNARSGCLFHGADPGAASRALHIEDVTIEGVGSWGVVLQGGMNPWKSWDYNVLMPAGETLAPSAELGVSKTLALPSLGGLSKGLILNDGGLVQGQGTVHVQLGLTGLNPGRGP